MKGGALYIAILVSIVIGVILSLFILIAHYNQRQVTLFSQSSQLYFNLQSAVELAHSDYFTATQNNQWIKNTFNDDSLKLKKVAWGAYILIASETKNRHQALSECGLYGINIPSDTGLVVSDNPRPIGLSGTVAFKANCYLPKVGTKPAFIDGQSYIASLQNTAFTKISNSNIPLVDKTILNAISEQQNNSNPYLDSVVLFLPQTFKQAFTSKTVVLHTNITKLYNLHLSNNVKIVSPILEVDSSCHLENLLIVCSKIKFKDGFKGKIHVIASDSIVMGKNCEFSYPSSFILIPKKENSSQLKCIAFNEGCRFYGGLIALQQDNTLTKPPKVFIKLHAKSEINGFIYSSDYLHLEGIVNATVITDKLLLKTASAIYENHLLSCEINPKKYSSILAIPSIFKKSGRLFCCQKIN